MISFLEACPTKLIFLLTLNFLQFSEHAYAKLITSVTLHMIFLPPGMPSVCIFIILQDSAQVWLSLKPSHQS